MKRVSEAHTKYIGKTKNVMKDIFFLSLTFILQCTYFSIIKQEKQRLNEENYGEAYKKK